MRIKARTKDRLMTAGTVLLICSMGVSLPGCATPPTHDSYPISIIKVRSYQCTTDFDCEMHLERGTTHSEWTWKKALGVVAAVVVTGYVYSRLESQGNSTASIPGPGPDIRTPGVTCTANGCAQ